MTNFDTLIAEAGNLLDQQAKYKANPTKKTSAAMRKTIATIQTVCVAAKRDLIATDAAMPVVPRTTKA